MGATGLLVVRVLRVVVLVRVSVTAAAAGCGSGAAATAGNWPRLATLPVITLL